MKRRIIRSEPRLLTPTPDENTLMSGLNDLLGPYDNSVVGDTTAHITLTVSEPSGITAGSLLYVYVLHETPAGFENGNSSVDPSISCIGAIAAKGSAQTHRVCFDTPIQRRQFKVLLQNEWDEDIDYSMYIETSSEEILE